MEEIRKHIESAYNMLGQIRVSGDAVDLMASSRAALREAHRLAVELADTKTADRKEAGDGQTD